jgi:hypothetical protein
MGAIFPAVCARSREDVAVNAAKTARRLRKWLRALKFIFAISLG